MLIIASKIIFCLVLVAIIAGVLGYLIGKAKYKIKEKVYDSNSGHRKPGNVYNKPFILGQPRPSGKDDLKMIDGVTHEMEDKLNGLGIFHFEQIAKWSPKNVEWVSDYFSIENRVNEESWIPQAKELMKK